MVAQAEIGDFASAKATAQTIENGWQRIKARFKRLLIPCVYYLDAAYKMCGLLVRLYPAR